MISTSNKNKTETKNSLVVQTNSKVKKKTIKTAHIGDINEFKITAIGLKNIGIDEYSLGYPVLIPNAKLGETIKGQILKLNLKNGKYAIAKKLEILKKSNIAKLHAKPGEILKVNIEKLTSKGAAIVELEKNYKLIIPNAAIGQNKSILITRSKKTYAFAKLILNNTETDNVQKALSDKEKLERYTIQSAYNLVQGSKFTLTLPKKTQKIGKYFVLKIKGSVVFIRQTLGVKRGNKIRIKISKVKNNIAIAQILRINPPALIKKQTLIKYSIRQMLKNGMHFGEKAIKCNIKMKNYIWLRKSGQNKNRPLIKKGRNMINLLKTRRCLNKALMQLSKYALKGHTFLFIGTKKPAASLIARASLFSKTAFFVNTRWLGGMLTNWKTILKSISKIRPILKEKQKIIRDILEIRQNIKSRLIKKTLLLKNKSKLILNKGRQLIKNLKNNPKAKMDLIKKAIQLSGKRKQLIENCFGLLKNRKILLKTRKELMMESQGLKTKGLELTVRYQSLLNQLAIASKKLKELKCLLILNKEITKLKKLAKQQDSKILNSSFGKLKAINLQGSKTDFILPNPPKDILSRIIGTIYSAKNDNGKQVSTKASSNKKVLVISLLMRDFATLGPYIESSIKIVQDKIQMIETYCQSYFNQIQTIKKILKNNIQLKNDVILELHNIKLNLDSQKSFIKLIKTKLKQYVSQKKFLKVLPKLKNLKISQRTITETVDTLMKKLVDPKLKYPIDNIYDEKLSTNSKKIAAARKKKWQRLEKYFGGVANMTKMTKGKIYQNVAIIIGQKEEMNAIRECQKLGIKMFNIVDTNCNPTFADHIIPANDDSRNSIKYILNKFLVRIRLAQKIKKVLKNAKVKTKTKNKTK